MWLIIFLIQCCIHNVLTELFTTYINFQKYYNMEEELISLTSAIIHQERIIHGDDVHNFTDITKLIDESKSIHSLYVNDEDFYLFHPINTFHLSKRLAWRWKVAIKKIMETDTCVKALKVKLQNMDDNVPDNKQLSEIAMSILNLDKFYDKTLLEIIGGEINGHFPLETLSLSDCVVIATAAFQEQQYYYTITWLNYVTQEMAANHIDILDGVYTRPAILNLLASAYFEMNHLDRAKAVTDEILSFQPGNELAHRNKEYFRVVKDRKAPLPIERPIPKRKSQRLFHSLCSQPTETVPSKDKCVYFPLRNKMWFIKPDVKAEVIRTKPLIILFHELVSLKTADALKSMGYHTLMNLTSQFIYSYPRQSSPLTDRTHWKWVPNLKQKIYNMDLTQMPSRNSKFNVMNIGLAGFQRKYEESKVKPVGTIVVSLSDSLVGGEVVFPLSKIKLRLQKGDAFFYEEDVPFSVCPVPYGTFWYGFQHIFEQAYPVGVCPPKRRVRRGY